MEEKIPSTYERENSIDIWKRKFCLPKVENR